MKCPKCGSEHVQYATNTYSRGISASKSCCGYIILGPLGLLFGLCGAGSKTEEFWICYECGNQFSNLEAQYNLEKLKHNAQKKLEQEELEKKEHEQYLHNKTAVEWIDQTPNGYEELVSRHKKAQSSRIEIEEQYKHYLEALKEHSNPTIRKLATKSLQTTGFAFAIAVCGIFVALFFDFLIGAILLSAGIAVGVFMEKKQKAAEAELAQLDATFSDYRSKLINAKSMETALDNTLKIYNEVKQYEQSNKK